MLFLTGKIEIKRNFTYFVLEIIIGVYYNI